MAEPRTLLAVHAHPDDESISMGGTLARYSAAGVRTVVVTCTTGDLGTIFDAELVRSGEPVATIRARELAQAGHTLGVSRLVQLGYADSGMAGVLDNQRPGAFWTADLDEATTRLLEVLEAEQPSVVVAYDETGGYGHPDHVKAHQVAVAAFARYAAAARLYFVRFPLGWAREFVRTLRASGIPAPGSAVSGADAGPEVAEIGVPDHLVTTRVDVRRYVPTKLAALACYRSQMPPWHFLRQMSPELAARLWAYEYFSLEHGAARVPREDLFEDLD